MAEPAPDRRASLFRTTVFFVALVCVVLIGLDINQSVSSYDARLRQAQTETENLSHSISQHIADIFETADTTLIGLRDAYLSENADPAAIARLERRMRVRVAIQRLLHGVLIVDEHGGWIASGLPPEQAAPLRGIDFSSYEFFRFHKDQPADVVLVGQPSRAQHDGAWLVSVSRRLNHPDGSFAGIVVTSIAFDLLQQFFATFSIGSFGTIALTNSQGVIVVRRPYEEDATGRSVAQSEFFRTIGDGATAGSTEYTSSIDGRSRIGSFRRIPGFGLVTFVALDKGEILRSWWLADARVQFLWASLAVISIAGLGYLLSLQIRRRVTAEIELAESNRNLELRVAERTAQLQAARDRAEQASQAKSEFLNMVSHELRTPLTQLQLQLDMQLRLFRGKLTEKQEQALSNTALAMQRLSRLVTSVLEYSRLRGQGLDAQFREIDLVELVSSICSDCDLNAKQRGLELVFEPDSGIPPVTSDPTLVAVVVHNLLDNAIKYTSEGNVTVRVRAGANDVHIDVMDTGPGIPAEFQARMFEPFEQAESIDRKHTPGVGLGLSLVKEITAHLGGRVDVISKIGVGSTFSLVLPLSSESRSLKDTDYALDSRD